MTDESQAPLIPASTILPELTFKVIIFSILLTAILAASNAYLAMKIGTTIAASIPASVIAMGILRCFKNSNILEVNLIQTAASGGEGVAAAISFVLPALVITHVWAHFPFWQTFWITIIGGFLGVMLSIPLRRVLLNLPILRFPEGTAVGNVLRASVSGKSQLGLLAKGAGIGGLVSFFQVGLKVFAQTLQGWFSIGKGLFGLSLGFSPALLAAGYIIGFETGFSLAVGVVIGWVIILPILSFVVPHTSGSVYDQVMMIWSAKLRFVGVGVMLVGGVWTLIRLSKTFAHGLRLSFQSLRKAAGDVSVERTDKDIPIKIVIIGVGVVSVFAFAMIAIILFSHGTHSDVGELILFSVIFVIAALVCAFLLSVINGYLVGLVGSTNSPLSGMVIVVLLVMGLLTLLLYKGNVHVSHDSLMTILLVICTMIATSSAITLENIQDLKAGQMVGATPMKQQIILCLGVVVSAIVIAPVMDLLFKAYGIGGVFPRAGMDPTQMLAAPQAALMAALAKAILNAGRGMPKSMILLGMGVAVLIIIADEVMRRKDKALPALAVGLGIYLPSSVMTPIIVGSLVNYFAKRYNVQKNVSDKVRKLAEHKGILLACGLVAGSALMGVLLAVPFVLMGSADGLRLMPHSLDSLAMILSILSYIGLGAWLYRSTIIRKD